MGPPPPHKHIARPSHTNTQPLFFASVSAVTLTEVEEWACQTAQHCHPIGALREISNKIDFLSYRPIVS